MSEEPTVLTTALDLVVFAPVGLMLTVGEEIPKLAAKGRARLGGRIAAARMIGQFAVAQGRREAGRRWGPSSPPPARPATPSPSASTAFEADAARSSGSVSVSASAAPTGSVATPAPRLHSAPAATPPSTPIPAAPARGPIEVPDVPDVPDVATLAIPGYASLSASQVVQRLAGLSGEELAAVGAYEASNRGRRTILARITQLQSR
jgi:hypothetical protein